MTVMNNPNSEEVGGTVLCILGCGVLCIGTSGAGTIVASGAYVIGMK